MTFDFISLDLSENQFYEKDIESLGGKIHKIGTPRNTGFILHLIRLIRIFKKYNLNKNLIVHSHTLHHCGLVMLAAKVAGVKNRISQARSSRFKDTGFKSRLFVFIGKLLIYFFATNKLAITQSTSRFLYFKCDINNGKVNVVPNAINLDKFENISLIKSKN